MGHVHLRHLLALLLLNACFLFPENDSQIFGTKAADPDPVAVDTSFKAQSLAIGGDTSCAIDSTHNLWCWGRSDTKIDASVSSRFDRPYRMQKQIYRSGTPVLVNKFSQVVQNDNMLCALVFNTGESVCWGRWSIGSSITQSFISDGGTQYSRLGIGNEFACGIRSDVTGQVGCFGKDSAGRGVFDPAVGDFVDNRVEFRKPFSSGDGFDDQATAVAKMSDGSLLVGGAFDYYNGVAAGGLAKLNGDGSLDNTFAAQVNSVSATLRGFDGPIFAIVVYENKIYVGGSFSVYNDQTVHNFVRLELSGALDATFTPPVLDGTVKSIAIDETDPSAVRIMVGGSFNTIGGVALDFSLLALRKVDGSRVSSVDYDASTSLIGEVNDIEVQAAHKILVGGNFSDLGVPKYLVQLDDTGVVASYGSVANDIVYDIVKIPSGQLLIAGAFSAKISRLNVSSGVNTRDGAFVPLTFSLMSSTPVVKHLTVDDLGRIIAVGDFDTYGTHPVPGILRMAAANATTFDATFDSGGGFSVASGTSVINGLLPIDIGGRKYLAVVGNFDGYNGHDIGTNFTLLNAGARGGGWPLSVSAVVDLQVANQNACALLTVGSQNDLYCWGNNGFAEISDETGTMGLQALVDIALAPVRVKANVNHFVLTASRLCYSYPISSTSAVGCRGAMYESADNVLGSGTTVNPSDTYRSFSTSMGDWPGLSATVLSSGTYQVSGRTYLDEQVIATPSLYAEVFDQLPFACYIDAGSVLCQGFMSSLVGGANTGRSGNSSTWGAWATLNKTLMVGANTNASAISLGKNHGCLITQDSIVHCWGDNSSGQLGIEDTSVASSASPIAVVSQ